MIELHDCFAPNELISYEALGLCPIGLTNYTPTHNAILCLGKGGDLVFLMLNSSYAAQNKLLYFPKF